MRPLLLSAFAVTLMLGVSAHSPGLADAASPFAGTYSGFTSQGDPVVLVVSSDGRQVKRASTGLVLTCSDGRSAFVSDGFRKLPLSRSGRASSRYANVAGAGWDDAPSTYAGALKVSIKPGTRALSGSWRQTQIAQSADGTTRVCSGRVTLTASAKRDPAHPLGGFYGGFTSQNDPVVVQLATDGRRVTAIRGLFDLKCSPSGYRFVADVWDRLPVSGGSNRFGDSARDQPSRFSDGTPFQWSAAVSGAVDRAGRTIKGRWRVAWTNTTDDGATYVCDSGQLTFAATR